MPYLDHSAQVTGVVLLVIFLPGLIVGLFAIWTSYKARMKGIDALRIYAEKGQEPPASLLEAIRPAAPPQPRRQTRAEAISGLAFAVVMAAGAAGFAWWASEHHGDSGLPMLAGVVAIVFAAIALAQLAAALTARNGD
jgi:apolipoprotein N-acyltransferase